MKNEEVKQIVKKHYATIAIESGRSCGCGDAATSEQIAKSIGYSDTEITSVSEANLGLGCGNPSTMGKIREGDAVLDLGSGAGIDCFLAAKKVGSSGKVIGVDMTQEMINRARQFADNYGYGNVEFRLGDIEQLPVRDNSIDVIISNCVINLAPDKAKVFSEARRVLKAGGRMYVSDIVLLEKLSEEQRNDANLIAGCVAGALLKDDYLDIIKNAGFDVSILSDDKAIIKAHHQGMPLESLNIEARKQ